MSVTRTFSSIAAVIGCVIALAISGIASAGDDFGRPDADFDTGIRAYKHGDVSAAVAAFEAAAARGNFLAKYRLAKLYSNNTLRYVDHVKAFWLFDEVAAEVQSIDLYDDPRATYVADAMVALAQYYQSGVPDAGIDADKDRALNLLLKATQLFDYPEAQFELGKALLGEVDNPDSVRGGRQYLERLAVNKGHAGALTYLADLYFRGDRVEGRLDLALALVGRATERAGEEDRIWVLDTYQRVYCNVTPQVRGRAARVLERLRQSQNVFEETAMAAGRLEPLELAKPDFDVDIGEFKRSCRGGELVMPLGEGSRELPNAVVSPQKAPGNGGHLVVPGISNALEANVLH